MDSNISQEFSEDIIKRYLDAEIYLQRGMTRQEYIEVCKEKWDNMKYDPQTEKKIIVDFLMPFPSETIGGSHPINSFDYFETYDDVDNIPEKRNDIECLVAKEVLFKTNSQDGLEIIEDFPTKIPSAEFFEEEDTLNHEMYFVALFDVLGFSNLVNKVGSKGVIDIYQKLINLTLLNKSYKSYERIRVAPNKYVMGTIYAPIKCTYFSDTIIFYLKVPPFKFYMVSPFVSKCADLICEALLLGIPLRGSINFGEGIMHKPTNTYIGKAITEAAQLEKDQKWLGASFCNSFIINEIREDLNEKLIVPTYCNHFKKGTASASPYLTLDWIDRWHSKEYPDLEITLVNLMNLAPEENKEYYQNTIDFIKFSEQQDTKSRALFLHSNYYRLDAKDFNSNIFENRFVIIKTKNSNEKTKDSEFIYGRIFSFNEETLLKNPGLTEACTYNLFIIKWEDTKKVDDIFQSNDVSRFNEIFSFMQVIERDKISYIDCIVSDPTEYEEHKKKV